MSTTPKKVTTNDFAADIMAKIHTNQIAMKPRWYFIAGSILAALGLIGFSMTAIFAVNLLFFLFRQHGPMGNIRLQQMLATFPWWIPIAALIGIILSISLLKRYDFSYKHHFGVIALGFIVAIVIAGFIIDNLGLNAHWSRRGPMRRLYHQLQPFTSPFPSDNFVPGRARYDKTI